MASSDHPFRPESLMMSHGYKPELSEGAIKCRSSRPAPSCSARRKRQGLLRGGLRHPGEGREGELGLIYSRLNNPDLRWRSACACGTERRCAVFESGMSAISTTLLEFLSRPAMCCCSATRSTGHGPLHQRACSRVRHRGHGLHPWEQEELAERVKASGKADRVKMIYIETPANPTNTPTTSVPAPRWPMALSTDERVLLAVDNTYMGPLWQHP